MTNPLREVVADALPELPVRVDAAMHMCGTGCDCPHEEWDYKGASIAMHQDDGEPVGTVVMLDEGHEEVMPEAATFEEAKRYACAWIDGARSVATLPTQSAGVEERARELLAAEYERAGFPLAAQATRDGSGFQNMEVRAIAAALRTPAKTEDEIQLETLAAIEREMRYIAPEMKKVDLKTGLDLVPYFYEAVKARTPASEGDGGRVDDGRDEDAYVTERLSCLLAEISVIVKGPHPANGLWSYHDLPEKVAALRTKQPAASEGDVDWAKFPYSDAWCNGLSATLWECGMPNAQRQVEEIKDFVRAARANTSKQAAGEAVDFTDTPIWQPHDLRDGLQRKCSAWGVYWRAPDAHGVIVTVEQATELLADAVGVEVEITTPPRHPADEGKDALCIHCGRPTMHIGNVCFTCSKAAKNALQAGTP